MTFWNTLRIAVDTQIPSDFRAALLNKTDVLHHLVCSLPVTAVATASGEPWGASGDLWEPLGASGSLWRTFGESLGSSGNFWGVSGSLWRPSGHFWGTSGSLWELKEHVEHFRFLNIMFNCLTLICPVACHF